MKFYTNISRYGNNLLYRGYQDGRRIKKKIAFKPTFYVKGKGNSKFTALDGTNVDAIKLDSMREAKEFIERYEDIENFKIYGNTNYISQFIAEEFPGEIKFERNKIRIHNIDIEVASDEGFPEPNEAKHPVISIAILDSVLDTYFVWALGNYDVSKSIMKEKQVRYMKCDNETVLLRELIKFWHEEHTCPDALTGWNIRTFDIPYLVNRIIRLLGPDEVKKISPWGLVEERMVTMKKGMVQIYDMIGIAQIDYMDIFQKFGYSFGPQESYRLDHIANVVLGERKLAYAEISNMFTLLTSSNGVIVSKDKPDDELQDFEKWCRLKDSIKEEAKLRKLI